MARLAYTTGLRPSEIARIRMNDISFEKGELTVPERKGKNPVLFPLLEETVKAVAAYVIGARPEKAGHNLFVSLSPPHNPVTGGLVSDAIAKVMRRAGVPGMLYWLRHTYAQNLLRRVGGATGTVGSAFRKTQVRRCTHPTGSAGRLFSKSKRCSDTTVSRPPNDICTFM